MTDDEEREQHGTSARRDVDDAVEGPTQSGAGPGLTGGLTTTAVDTGHAAADDQDGEDDEGRR